MFAVQYLQDGPHIPSLTPEQVGARLRAAFERLPLSAVLLGWHLPERLLHACREETARHDARLFRWHPLLTGDGTLMPKPAWQTVGLDGSVVPGFCNMPEFTFVCPNRPAVRDAVLAHLRQIVRRGEYDGFFLDRIRYPSPAADPTRLLACFCDDCRRVAAEEGLDLDGARQRIVPLLSARQGDRAPVRPGLAVQVLLDPTVSAHLTPELMALRAVLDFRTRSITRFVRAAVDLIRGEGLAVGLDCFSPALVAMVGQDLSALAAHCDWIKVMSYGHVFGPAGLPFELLDLADWLSGAGAMGERDALAWLSTATRLPLPSTMRALRESGLSSYALADEIERARRVGVKTVLAGVELVEIEGVCALDEAQITSDLRAMHAAGVDGLVLSWDLWHMPLERLDLVRSVWGG